MLIAHRSSMLQRMQEAATHGYIHCIHGLCEIDKVADIYRKMNALYDTELDKNKRHRMRKSGKCASKWFATVTGQNTVAWFVMTTDGDGFFYEHEAKNIVPASGLNVFYGYKLTRQTKPENDQPVWTFALTRNEYERYENRITSAINKKSLGALQSVFSDTQQLIHLAGVRSDLKRLYKHARGLWKRNMKSSVQMPKPPQNRYLRRVSTITVEPSKVMQRMKLKNETAHESLTRIGNNKLSIQRKEKNKKNT